MNETLSADDMLREINDLMNNTDTSSFIESYGTPIDRSDFHQNDKPKKRTKISISAEVEDLYKIKEEEPEIITEEIEEEIDDDDLSEYLHDVPTIAKTMSRQMVKDVKDNFDVAHKYVHDNRKELLADFINYIIVMIVMSNTIIYSMMTYFSDKIFNENNSIFNNIYQYLETFARFILIKVSTQTLENMSMYETKYELMTFWTTYQECKSKKRKIVLLKEFFEKNDCDYNNFDFDNVDLHKIISILELSN